MKKSAALVVVTLALQEVVSFAGPPPSKEVVAPPPPPPVSYFRPNEFDIGAFGTCGTNFGDNHRGIGDHAWGGGVDVAYFAWLYAGFRIQGSVVDLIPGDNTAGIVSGWTCAGRTFTSPRTPLPAWAA